MSENIPESRKEFYTVVREIASGAYGVVYEIEVIKDFNNGEFNFHKGMRLAMKIPKEERQKNLLDMDIPEVDILNRINHINVINAYETLKAEKHGNCYGYIIIMPLASYNLRDLIKTRRLYEPAWVGKYTQADVLDISYQLLCGLNYLHINHIIHDDIKTANVLIFEDEKNRFIPKITDFGLSATATGSCNIKKVYGTVGWKAPEVRNKQDINYSPYKNDIWAMGVVLLKLSTKRRLFIWAPFEKGYNDESDLEIIQYMDAHKTWKNDKSLRGELKGLIDVIEGMLTFDPDQRVSASDALKYPVFNGMGCQIQQIESFTWDMNYPDVNEYPETMNRRREIFGKMERNNMAGSYRDDKHYISWNTLFLSYDIFDRYIAKLYQLGLLTKNYMYDEVAFAAMYLSYELNYIPALPYEIMTAMSVFENREGEASNLICDVMEKLDWKLTRPTLYQQHPEIDPVRLYRCFLKMIDPTSDCIREVNVCI